MNKTEYTKNIDIILDFRISNASKINAINVVSSTDQFSAASEFFMTINLFY